MSTKDDDGITENDDGTKTLRLDLGGDFPASEDLVLDRDHLVETATLVVQLPEGKVEEFSLPEGPPLIVGRERGDIPLANRSVSASHCTFSVEAGVVFLMDNGSTNGTFLNRQKLKPRQKVIVDNDDEVFVGQVMGRIRMANYSPWKPLEQEWAFSKEQDAPTEASADKSKLEFEAEFAEEKPRAKKGKAWLHKLSKARAKKQLSKSKGPSDLAHPIFRLLAVAIDAILSSFLVGFMIPLPFIAQMVEGWNKSFGTEWAMQAQTSVGEIIFKGLFFFLFRLLAVLCFGVSLGQLAMGLRGAHGYMRNRIGGMVRVVFDVVLGLFLVFDAPLLLGKRSVKEVISGTLIVHGPLPLRLVGAFVFIPLAIFLALISDFTGQWDYREGLAVTSYKLPAPKNRTEGRGEQRSFLELTSKVFQFSSSPYIDQERALFLLGLEIISQNKRKRFRSHLALFDRKFNGNATLKVHSTNKLYEFLQQAFEDSEFMAEQYPLVKELLDRPLKVYAPSEGPEEGGATSAQKAQLGQVLEDALSLNTGMLLDKITSLNFSYSGLLKLRSIFVHHFGLNPSSQIQRMKLNNHIFLRINPQEQTTLGTMEKVYLMPMDSFNGPIYEINYSKRGKGEVVAVGLLQLLFDEGRFYFDQPPPVASPSDEADATLGQCIDTFLNAKASPEQLIVLHQSYHNYLEALVSSHLERGPSQRAQERKFLLQELSSLSELERVFSKRHQSLAERAAQQGFQIQWDRVSSTQEP